MASSPIGGALPAQMPPAANVGKTDKAIAHSTASKLLDAVANTKDPNLKAEFSKALASFHSYLTQDSQEARKGQARKVSVKAAPKPKKK